MRELEWCKHERGRVALSKTGAETIWRATGGIVECNGEGWAKNGKELSGEELQVLRLGIEVGNILMK